MSASIGGRPWHWATHTARAGIPRILVSQSRALPQMLSSLQRSHSMSTLRGDKKVELSPQTHKLMMEARRSFERTVQEKHEREEWIKSIDVETALPKDLPLHPRFNEEMDTKLLTLVKQMGPKNWRVIGSQLDMSAEDCRRRWRTFLDPRIKKGAFTAEEDEKLMTLVDLYGTKWWLLSEHFEHTRTPKQLCERWMYTVKPNTVLGQWGKDEIEALLAAVAKHGEDFAAIAQDVGNGRSVKSCRNKFIRFAYAHTEDGSRVRPFKAADDLRLIRAVERSGRTWEAHMQAFPGRSSRFLQMRYDSSLCPRSQRRRWRPYELNALRQQIASPTIDVGQLVHSLSSKERVHIRARIAFEIGLDDDRQLDWPAFSSAPASMRAAALSAFRSEVLPTLPNEQWAEGAPIMLAPKDGQRPIPLGRYAPIRAVGMHPAIRPFVRPSVVVERLAKLTPNVKRLVLLVHGPSGEEAPRKRRSPASVLAGAQFRAVLVKQAGLFRCPGWTDTGMSVTHLAQTLNIIGLVTSVDATGSNTQDAEESTHDGTLLPKARGARRGGASPLLGEEAEDNDDGSSSDDSDDESSDDEESPAAAAVAHGGKEGDVMRIQALSARIDAGGQKDYRLYTNRGVLHEKMGNMELALQDYETAVQLNPLHAQSRMYAAEMQFATGNTDAAYKSVGVLVAMLAGAEKGTSQARMLDDVMRLAESMRAAERDG